MSMILTARALQIKTGNPLRKLVLVKLADNANDQGESWPSVPYIAEQCEISERSVQNHINALVKMGLVRVESRKSANGLNQSNIYHLCLDATAVSGESPAPCGANPAGGVVQMVPGLVQQIHQVVQLVPIVVQELHPESVMIQS